MFKSVLLSGSIMNAWGAVGLKSPQWLIICLILQASLAVLLIGLLKSVWFSYILFLVFLGGLLIIFVYVESLVPKVKLGPGLGGGLMATSVILVGACSVVAYGGESVIFGAGVDLANSKSLDILSASSASWGKIIYSYSIFYLLLTLACVCWIVKSYEGPLRLLK